MKFGAWILLTLVWGGPSGPVSPACPSSPTQLSCCDVYLICFWVSSSALWDGWLLVSCGESFPEIILVPDT